MKSVFFFKRMTIKAKLMVIISLIITISMSFMILLATEYFKKSVQIKIEENNHRLTNIIGQKIKSDLVSLSRSAFVLGNYIMHGFGSQEKIIKSIFFEDDENLISVSIGFLKNKKIRILHSMDNRKFMEENQIGKRDIENLNERNNEFYLKSFDGLTILHNASLGFPIPVVGLSLPFEFNKEKGKKIVILYFRLEKILKFFPRAGITEIFMVNHRGDVIIHPDSRKIFARANISDSPIVRKMMTSKLSNGQMRFSDKKNNFFLASFHKVGIGNVGFVAKVSEEKAFADVYQIQIRNLYILGIILTLAILIVFFFAKTLSSPIIQLVNMSMRFQKKAFHAREAEGKNEILYLSKSFHSMIRYIRASQSKLENYAQNLEREVKERTRELVQAKRESDTIMKSINEGLFLLDKDFQIAGEYSSELESILNLKDLGKKNLKDLIHNFLDKKEGEAAIKYLNLLFNNSFKESMLVELNPLNDFEFKMSKGNNEYKIKYLDFKFRRIIDNSEIIFLLVTVNDITRNVLLNRELAEVKEKNKIQMENLFNLMQVEPSFLSNFLIGTEMELSAVTQILENKSESKKIYDNLNELMNLVHSIKGNAFMLDLEFMAGITHRFENAIEIIQAKGVINEKDIKILEDFRIEIENWMYETKGFLDRVSQLQKLIESSQSDSENYFLKVIQRKIKKIAYGMDKEVDFTYDHFDYTNVPKKYNGLLKDIIIQMVRNSLIHGIETISEREEKGKKKTGKITLDCEKNGNQFIVYFKDDGKGIDIDAIKKKAIDSKKYSELELKELDEEKIAYLIFNEGFSTAGETTMNAGRGVGMNLIKEKVEKAGGNISVTFSKGEYSQFAISLPLS